MRLRHVVTLAVVLLAGCGGGEESKPRTAVEPDATPAPTAASSGRATVKIVDFEYTPKNVEVSAGTQVTWIDKDAANHTVTFAKGPGDLGNVDQGRRLKARFTKPGRYAYVCQYHPNMAGTVTVR
ncbi:MAG TPA: cupredoxin domain-containing protein [Solirubrobacteraceae bacterium]